MLKEMQQHGKSMEYDEFILRLDEQLQAKKCTIWRKPQISSTREVALFATRIEWSFFRISVHILVDYIDKPTDKDFITFFENSLVYSQRALCEFSGGSLLKVRFSSFAIIPCLACQTADPETIEWVCQRQRYPRHDFDFYPVLHCLSANKSYYWKGFDFVGSLLWPRARRLIEESVIAVSVQAR